jgi:hypothetical protein
MPTLCDRSIVMQHGQRWIAAGLIVPCLAVGACARSSSFDSEAAGDEHAARVEPVKGTDVARITLTSVAARRIGIQTAPTGETRLHGGAVRRTVPYDALLYDAQGRPFIYINPLPLKYQRQPVAVASIRRRVVLLRGGPAPGTRVVTVGAAELLGTEYGVEE